MQTKVPRKTLKKKSSNLKKTTTTLSQKTFPPRQTGLLPTKTFPPRQNTGLRSTPPQRTTKGFPKKKASSTLMNVSKFIVSEATVDNVQDSDEGDSEHDNEGADDNGDLAGFVVADKPEKEVSTYDTSEDDDDEEEEIERVPITKTINVTSDDEEEEEEESSDDTSDDEEAEHGDVAVHLNQMLASQEDDEDDDEEEEEEEEGGGGDDEEEGMDGIELRPVAVISHKPKRVKCTPEMIRNELESEEDKQLFDQIAEIYKNADFLSTFIAQVAEKIDAKEVAYLPKSQGCQLHNWINGVARFFLQAQLAEMTGNAEQKIPSKQATFHSSRVYDAAKENPSFLETLKELYQKAYNMKNTLGGWKVKKTKKKPPKQDEDDRVPMSEDSVSEENRPKRKRKRKNNAKASSPMQSTAPSTKRREVVKHKERRRDGEEEEEEEEEMVQRPLSNFASCLGYKLPHMSYITENTIDWIWTKVVRSSSKAYSLEHLMRRSHFGKVTPGGYDTLLEKARLRAISFHFLNEDSKEIPVTLQVDHKARKFMHPARKGKEGIRLYADVFVFYGEAILRMDTNDKLCFYFPLVNLYAKINQSGFDEMVSKGIFTKDCISLGESFHGWFCVTNSDHSKGEFLFIGK